MAISIHALREESDSLQGLHCVIRPDFNPRSPWGERPKLPVPKRWLVNISIHALREESDIVGSEFMEVQVCISIHALREESDIIINTNLTVCIFISIHALREESDSFWLWFMAMR